MSRTLRNIQQGPRAWCALWRRVLDDGSDEFCSIRLMEDDARVEGTLVGLTSSRQPFACSYQILANSSLTAARQLLVSYRGVEDSRSLSISRTASGWSGEGSRPASIDAEEIDLEWSPITNLFPIRRLIDSSEASLTITAAWVRASDLRIEEAVQRYDRVDDRKVQYTNLGSGFSALIHHDGDGFPLTYEGVWNGRAFWSSKQ